MAIIVIKQEGMETYTGMMGNVDFIDGVSSHHVSKMDAQRIAGVIWVETLEGEDPSEAGEYAIIAEGGTSPINYEQDLVVETEGKPVVGHTREFLESVADKSGLAGLRELAEPYDIKSNSIVSMIEKMVEYFDAQNKQPEL